MLRDIDLSKISDGKRYKANDMVKISANGCVGCSQCCRNTVDTIRLDPYDMYQLEKGLGMTFDQMMAKEMIQLTMIESIVWVTLKKQARNHGCAFLNPEGRCDIHDFRPGFCRMFPLGRVYEDDDFSYYFQVHECPYPNKSKVKIKQWLGIPNLPKYEEYILIWHDFTKLLSEKLKDMSDEMIKKTNMNMVNLFFIIPYDPERDFYEQFDERVQRLVKDGENAGADTGEMK